MENKGVQCWGRSCAGRKFCTGKKNISFIFPCAGGVRENSILSCWWRVLSRHSDIGHIVLGILPEKPRSHYTGVGEDREDPIKSQNLVRHGLTLGIPIDSGIDYHGNNNWQASVVHHWLNRTVINWESYQSTIDKRIDLSIIIDSRYTWARYEVM